MGILNMKSFIATALIGAFATQVNGDDCLTDIDKVGDDITSTGTALSAAAVDCVSHGGSPKKCDKEVGQIISSLKDATTSITKAVNDCSAANPKCKADVTDIASVIA